MSQFQPNRIIKVEVALLEVVTGSQKPFVNYGEIMEICPIEIRTFQY